MTTGFILRSLRLEGIGVKPATLQFSPGLNVIAGPSDTGKTFIVQCIDFALGGGTPPRDIARARKYTSVMLDIEAADGRVYSLERGLRGGDIRVAIDGRDTRTIGAKHDPKRLDTVSHLLLSLCGLDGKKIRTDQTGKTRAMSFRDIAPLVVVDEESVITTRSPVLSGQFITKTAEGSVFRFLLTGADDSGVIAKEDPKLLKVREEGKTEVLAALLERARQELLTRDLVGTLADKRDQFARAQAAIEHANEALLTEQANVGVIEERRQTAWSRLRHIESRSNVLVELQKRFELLKSQYESDLRRLEAVAEAGFRLGQLKQNRCPVCGALPEHHHHEHGQEDASPADVAKASRAEAEKTLLLLNDLHTTLSANNEEIQQLSEQRVEWTGTLSAAEAELKTEFQPRLQTAVQRLRDLQAQLDAIRPDLELFVRVEEYENLLAEASLPRGPQKRERAGPPVSSAHAEALSRQAEALLRAWNFPDLERVVFSEEDLDIVISGEPRASHGKGVRAITHAAFNLALLAVCRQRQMPFPAMLVIDSPLVVYQEPDPEEEQFPLGVKDAFYRSIASTFADSQVIVLENDKPPADLESTANIVLFTGTNEGRRGFIPDNEI